MSRVYLLLHYMLVVAYLLAPVVAVGRAVWLQRRGAGRTGVAGGARLAMLGTIVAGTAMGVSLSVVYAVAVKGRVSIWQAVLASYFATALMVLLKGFDWLLRQAVWRLSVRRAPAGDGLESRQRFRPGVALAGNLVRVVVLFGFGLPFVMAAVVTYRPRVLLNDDPMSQLGFAFERVQFTTADGVTISGWWVPARRGSRAAESDRTVVVCHGLGSNKSNQLILCRKLVPGGFNVLAIDMRAHGESGGQLSGFGDLERSDVLAAVGWLKEFRAGQAAHVYGLGASQGAAAVIAAAADPSPEGQAIEAVAVYGTYDDLQGLVSSIASKTFLPPLNVLVDRLALPIASAHIGVDLRAFRPAELTDRIWPRPILVIHGVQDQIIDFSHGRNLYEKAWFPKDHLWIDRGDHNSIINNDDAAEAVRAFFTTAEAKAII